MAVQMTYPTTESVDFVSNAVFGKNIFSFYNDTAEPVFMTTTNIINSELIGTVRQSVNSVGYSHFDMSSMLQNNFTYVENLETISSIKLHYGFEERPYSFVYGKVNTDGSLTNEGFYYTYTTIPGRKNFYELGYDLSEYTINGSWAVLGGDNTYFINNTLFSSLTDYPSLERDITLDEDYTLTFLSTKDTQDTTNPSRRDIPLTDFYFALYDENINLLEQFYIQNTQVNGGQFLTYPADAEDSQMYSVPNSYNLGATSIACGKSNVTLNTALVNNPTTKFYIVRAMYGSILPTNGSPAANPVILSKTYRFNLSECDGRDYSHIQVSWINSFGFRDYFTFTKKHEESLSIKRNTFDRQNGNWGGTTFVINPEERGKKQFNSKVTQKYSLQTKFLTDEENEYLKNLLISPDVKIRFEGEDTWYPVVLTTNNWTEKTFRKDKFYQLNINVEMANKIITQNNQ